MLAAVILIIVLLIAIAVLLSVLANRLANLQALSAFVLLLIAVIGNLISDIISSGGIVDLQSLNFALAFIVVSVIGIAYVFVRSRPSVASSKRGATRAEDGAQSWLDRHIDTIFKLVLGITLGGFLMLLFVLSQSSRSFSVENEASDFGTITIKNPILTPQIAGGTTTLYFTITNQSEEDMEIVQVVSTLTDTHSFHEARINNSNVYRDEVLNAIAVPAGGRVTLSPPQVGGTNVYIALHNISTPLTVGEQRGFIILLGNGMEIALNAEVATEPTIIAPSG